MSNQRSSARTEIYAAMRKAVEAKSDSELMNYLQDRGMVADSAETIDDVPNSDLMLAFNAITK